MIDLIERIEAASGPDRDIDLLIMRHVENIGGPAENTLPYTASIDAAMTLLPEGLGNGCFFLQRSRSFGCIADVWTDTEFNRYKKGKGKTPALALCAAALKARADCLARYGEDIFGDGK